ncbi:hypothetical protein [Nostoc sp. 'Lobaria pulmonaria (5183) cyanobiont']|uniref:hypothetical protein n=1 Tax=Nostoc sp. 'Lobaria pulmonaria (5183) cyanobiont' TaxID=1618022 RepID=UPI00131A0A60|nr:hypothetical protein [Nostoc sp. 'Lobaria pulmonaria (5183) cyanobiont']
MKVILKISTGETAETTELIGVLEFPNFILSKGHLYKRVEQNLSEATYQWEECLHI